VRTFGDSHDGVRQGCAVPQHGAFEGAGQERAQVQVDGRGRAVAKVDRRDVDRPPHDDAALHGDHTLQAQRPCAGLQAVEVEGSMVVDGERARLGSALPLLRCAIGAVQCDARSSVGRKWRVRPERLQAAQLVHGLWWHDAPGEGRTDLHPDLQFLRLCQPHARLPQRHVARAGQPQCERA
jgi:hypothetical protein